MRTIFCLVLSVLLLINCSKKTPCDLTKNREFDIKFPSSFPFGRNKLLDEYVIKISGKIINYDNSTCSICLPLNQSIDTVFWANKSDKAAGNVLAMFKNGEKYSVFYNECENMFQFRPEIETDLIMEYRVKVANLVKGDTIETLPLFGDVFYITDSTFTDWGRITYSANCNNSFKYIWINKAIGIKKKCEEINSSDCYLEADSTQTLQTITFQQLHNEKLEIYYDYKLNKVSLKLK